MNHTRVKICCIQSVAEAQIASKLGADAIGLVAHMPSGPGVIPEAEIHRIARATPPGVSTFLLTSYTTATEIIAQHRRCDTDTLQLTDRLQPGALAELRSALAGVRIVQVVHVTGEDTVVEALALAPEVDALLLDSGDPTKSIKELGGTGRVHNWNLSKEIVANCRCPVFLAGGLHPGNIRQAIETVQPYGVDVCTGVRTNSALDPVKVEQFIREAKILTGCA